jgi:hypothetical protein
MSFFEHLLLCVDNHCIIKICLLFMNNAGIKLLLSKESGKILVVEKVQDLLPLAFTGKDLKRTDHH